MLWFVSLMMYGSVIVDIAISRGSFVLSQSRVLRFLLASPM